jgi:acylglycerol lipase
VPPLTKSEVNITEEFISTQEAIDLHIRSNIQSHPNGVVVIVHGVGEHLGRYPFLEQWFIAQGYNCYLYDHRGYGLSGGIKGDVKSFDDYANDLDIIYRLVKKDNPFLPIIVFGHSMGSLVVLLNLILHPGKWNGVIVTGVPLMIVKPIPKWQEVLGNLVVRIIPTFYTPSDIDPAFLSHDEAVIEAYKTDKLVQHKVTIRWGLAFIAAVKEVTARLSEITETMLIMHGGDDKVSGVEGARFLADTLGTKQAQLIIYPGLYHELHNERETDRNKVFESIKSWLTRYQTNLNLRK